MIAKKKGALGAVVCLLTLLISILTNPTVSRYVLESAGAILKTVITSPPISATFQDGETVIHTEDKLSNGMKLINLKTSYENYTTYSDDTGENTIPFDSQLRCPECGGSIASVNDGEYIGCACGVTFEGWMNASGNLPTEITVVRNIVLNAKWNIPNKFHLDFIDLDGNIVLSKKFTSGQLKVEITDDDVDMLNNAAAAMGTKLTEEANGSMIVTAAWEGYTTAQTYTMSAADETVQMKLTFTTTTNKTVQIEPHTDENGIIDINGDGYPDSYKVVDAILGDSTVDFTIPDYILGSPVTEIAGGAFAGDGRLRDIFIPSTITEIGANAFTEDKWGEYPQIQIFFDGTKAEWDSITKASDWHDNIGTGSVVVCLQEDPAGYYKQTGSNGFIGIGAKVVWTWQSGEYNRDFGEG